MSTDQRDLAASIPFIASPGQAVPDPAVQKRKLSLPNPRRTGLALRAHGQPGADKIEGARCDLSDESLYELVLGRSNMLPAHFLSVGTERARAVCKIEAHGKGFTGKTGSWVGTGFLIAPNILLTNHHVLNSADVAQTARCLFNFQTGADGKPLPCKVFTLDPGRLFVTSPVPGGLDFTFVWVNGDPGAEFGVIHLDRRSFSIDVKELANIVHHPAGELKAVTLQENEVTWQNELLVHYVTDTKPGSSGSPVFDNQWRIVALHHAHARAEPAQASGGEAGYVNEGIKISSIAAELERLAEDRDGAVSTSARQALSQIHESDARLGYFATLGRRGGGESCLETLIDRYQGKAQDIDVGCWNIEWFNRTWERKLADVAQAIVAMNLDIWALVETSPAATRALVRHLNGHYGLTYECDFSEPDAPASKQTTAVIWNSSTVRGKREAWSPQLEPLFHAHSQDFSELGLEAVEGAIFDRYPGLFWFSALGRDDLAPFDFFLVPLHLKAMAEGARRRRMAAQILAYAIQQEISAHQRDADFVVLGDFNAELATGDFAHLSRGGLVALGAADEQQGAFSYLKRPNSLIDQVFLSPNLAQTYGPQDYFIVAADREFPGYVQRLSDHRPVVVRFSLNDQASVRPRRQPRRLPADLVEELRRVMRPHP